MHGTSHSHSCLYLHSYSRTTIRADRVLTAVVTYVYYTLLLYFWIRINDTLVDHLCTAFACILQPASMFEFILIEMDTFHMLCGSKLVTFVPVPIQDSPYLYTS